MKKPSKKSFTWKSITESRLFFPLLALSLILLFDFIFIPGFFSIENRDGNLYGSLIDILRNGSTVMLLAIGMTLVIATGWGGSFGGRCHGDCRFGGGDFDESIRTSERSVFRHRSNLHLPATLACDWGSFVRLHPVRFVEWDAGRLYAHPAHGGDADLDDFRARHRPADHQRAAGPDHLSYHI